MGEQREQFHNTDTDDLRERWRMYLQANNLNTTQQRELIVDHFLRCRDHVSIDELLTRVRKRNKRVGYATVYRTLKMLTESGVVQEHKFGDGHTRYELADEDAHHDHLICLSCGNITEFEEPAVEALQDRIATRHGFEVTAHKHELYGTCADCQKKRKRPG